MSSETGNFFIVSTPIGNKKDITLRALEVLKEVDLIACEDTRHTHRLLKHYEIKKALISYFEHNKTKRAPQIIKWLKEGKNVALVSDAGTPGICDPGYYVIRLARQEEIPVSVIPGPSALITALIASGKPPDKFIFEGYLPRKKGVRRKKLEALAVEERTVIFYESPYRLLKSLEDIEIFFKDRKICCCRELTKKFEEVITDTPANLVKHYREKSPKGEFVLVL
ncbi:MAG: 16S rRNA (cytidine(1402)-2'-O)-methyltransferase [Candidatus Omnitrophica bacterium]|nr:16S rRNA (cytidine(1402)-2'-O)-methyltransferase [Candidatus Omnitrophota bacterium]